jgi:hypothetical protein
MRVLVTAILKTITHLKLNDMKLFGYSRKGFLYIDTGSNLISQQTTSDESNMMNKYSSLMEYDNFDVAKEAYNR